MYQDILVPNLAAIEVEKAYRSALENNEAMFRSNREMLVDFYESQQTDKDEYLKDYFNLETDPTRGADYPHNLILTQLNVTSKIIDKKAKCYLKQPVRLIDGNQNEKYDEILYGAGIKTASKLADRMTWLLGDHCLVVVADKKTKTLRIDQPPYYIPAFAPGNMVDPVGVSYPAGMMQNRKGEWVYAWQYWDEKNHIIFENSTWNVLLREANEHGVFNALFTHRMKPSHGHWTRDAQDLVDNNRDINIALTAINNAFRYQGFPNLVLIGIGEEDARKIKVRFDKALSLVPSGNPAEKLDAKYLASDVQWGSLIKTIKDRIELLSTTWNVSIQWDMTGNIASGVALKILSVDNRDDVNDMVELYEEYLEVPLFKKLQTISQRVSWIGEIPGKKLTLDWPEWETIESAEERMLRIKTDLSYNLTNPVRELMRDNPDLTEGAAKVLYLKNKELNDELGIRPEAIDAPSKLQDKKIRNRPDNGDGNNGDDDQS